MSADSLSSKRCESNNKQCIVQQTLAQQFHNEGRRYTCTMAGSGCSCDDWASCCFFLGASQTCKSFMSCPRKTIYSYTSSLGGTFFGASRPSVPNDLTAKKDGETTLTNTFCDSPYSLTNFKGKNISKMTNRPPTSQQPPWCQWSTKYPHT